MARRRGNAAREEQSLHPGAGPTGESSSRQVKDGKAWDFGAQKALKPPDTRLALGIHVVVLSGAALSQRVLHLAEDVSDVG